MANIEISVSSSLGIVFLNFPRLCPRHRLAGGGANVQDVYKRRVGVVLDNFKEEAIDHAAFTELIEVLPDVALKKAVLDSSRAAS